MEASKPTFDAQKYGHNDGPSGTKNYWLSILTVLGCFTLFIVFVLVAYLPPNQADSSGQTEVVQARLTRLEEMRAKEATMATQYAWVDKEKGIVRIPLERAVELLPTHLKQQGVSMAAAASTPATAAPAEAVSESAAPASSSASAAIASGLIDTSVDPSADIGEDAAAAAVGN